MRAFLAGLAFSLLACCSPEARENEAADDVRGSSAASKLAGATFAPGGYPTIIYAAPTVLDDPIPGHPVPPDSADPGELEAVRKGRSAEEFLRVFPTMDREPGLVPLLPLYGTLRLRDGCIAIEPAYGGGERAFAVFSPGTRAFVDAEGYLSIGHTGPRAPPPIRIGEEINFGMAPDVTEKSVVKAVRDACGAGPLQWINNPSSYYRTQLEEAARNAPRAAEIHAVSLEVARSKMLEELHANEAIRRRCTLTPDQSCRPVLPKPGEPIDSWLIVWPPPPPKR